MDPQAPPPPPQQTPEATAVEQKPPAPAAPRRRTRPLAVLLLIALLLGLFGSVMLNLLLMAATGLGSLETDRKVQEKFFSHNKRSRNKVAIITLSGTIIDGEGFIKRQIDRAKKDKNLKAVVLRIDSPGGTITGSDSIYHQLRELKKESEIPLVVSMGGLAASGGYYVAMACGDTPQCIFAEPTTWTGSIGVIIPHYNLAGLMKDFGIQEDSVTSHPLKSMGSFAKPMTEQERKIFQELVDEGFTQFKDVIKYGRPKFKKDPEALDKLATGQIYTAAQAKRNGLVDRIGFLKAAVDRAIELAALEQDDVNVVRYKREPNLADMLLGAQAAKQPFDLAKMLEMTAPRAYYLCTWLPPLSSSP